MKQTENEMNVNVPLEVIKASEIEPKEVKWLWYPYIPLGKVTLLQGDPGDGKSKLMLSIAALLSKGEPLPFTETEETEPMTIIYQTTEDDADDTVVPRFNSAGGNGENLIFIKEDEKSLSFGDNRIAEAIERYHAKLLILDPMSSYIGENCSMNNANETRAEFNHLIAVAKNTGCAIVIIAHMNKMRDTNPLYRTNGSKAPERQQTPPKYSTSVSGNNPYSYVQSGYYPGSESNGYNPQSQYQTFNPGNRTNIEMLIGKNAEYYVPKFNDMKARNTKSSWNWCAFLFTPYWMIYRKMYGYGAAVLGGMFLLSLIGGVFLSLVSLAAYIVFGILGNYVYMQTLEKKALQMDMLTGGYKTEYANKNGGTNTAATVLTIIGYAILTTIIQFA